MEEIWKDIENYEGYYQVSNLGNVKSLDREFTQLNKWGKYSKYKKIGKELKKIIDNDGYYQVSLCKSGSQKEFKIHRLVGIAFIENNNNLPIINHIDANKKNNEVSNLEWCTVEFNNKHAFDNKLFNPKSGENHHFYKSGNKFLSKIVLDMQTGIFYNNVREAAIAKNITIKRLYKKLGGFSNNNTGLIYA